MREGVGVTESDELEPVCGGPDEEALSTPLVRPKRRPLSKRLRFEIFKRDHFMCVYCGRTPPEVVLEVDHLEPVAAGGSDNPANLFTACRECNLGKSDRRIENALPQVRPEEIDEMAERVEQMRAYQEWRRQYEARLRLELDALYQAWIDEFGGHVVEGEDGRSYECDVDFPTEKMLLEYLEQLPASEIIAAIRSAGWRYRRSDAAPISRWELRRYFYAICKRKAQQRDEDRRQVQASWPQLIAALPELETLRLEVAGFDPLDPWHFCGDRIWKHGWQVHYEDGVVQDVPAPVARIGGLVGPRSENANHPVLGSLTAHELAVRTIRSGLPACGQTCACGRPKRVPRPEHYPRCGACGQVYEPVDRRESCVEVVTTWHGLEFASVPYGGEPWLNLVTIAENYSRWRRLATPRGPDFAHRCSGCHTPIGGIHHPGCRQEACLICGERVTSECGSRDHRAPALDFTTRQLAARLRRRARGQGMSVREA
jgi:5-methylcytosine-specific restriction endonuclease McrA